MKTTFRLIEEIGPDLDPEIWAELQKCIRTVQEAQLCAAFGYTAENMSAATPARVEKVVQGERLE